MRTSRRLASHSSAKHAADCGGWLSSHASLLRRLCLPSKAFGDNAAATHAGVPMGGQRKGVTVGGGVRSR